jgi:hypothetical protein
VHGLLSGKKAVLITISGAPLPLLTRLKKPVRHAGRVLSIHRGSARFTLSPALWHVCRAYRRKLRYTHWKVGVRAMSLQAIEFVESWVSENISAKGYRAKEINSQAEAFAVQCIKAAKAKYISQAEIDAAFDDLTKFMAGEIEEANDRESARLTAKNV